jgi:anti-sigma B factor antagonist
MPIRVRSAGQVQIVELSGDFTIGRSSLAKPLDLQGRPMDDLGEVLSALFDRGFRQILLDLRHVTFIDSAGLGELVASKKRALERGGDIKILRPAQRVHELLVMTLLTRIFEIHEDEAAAVRSF